MHCACNMRGVHQTRAVWLGRRDPSPAPSVRISAGAAGCPVTYHLRRASFPFFQNDATKNEANKEMLRLKKQVRRVRVASCSCAIARSAAMRRAERCPQHASAARLRRAACVASAASPLRDMPAVRPLLVARWTTGRSRRACRRRSATSSTSSTCRTPAAAQTSRGPEPRGRERWGPPAVPWQTEQHCHAQAAGCGGVAWRNAPRVRTRRSDGSRSRVTAPLLTSPAADQRWRGGRTALWPLPSVSEGWLP